MTQENKATGNGLNVAIIGAGMGGLTAASCLRRIGMNVRIYEQTTRFARIGAGIQQGPNSTKVLAKLGLESQIQAKAFQPTTTNIRVADTGQLIWEKTQGTTFKDLYGAPHYMLHRGDLHEILKSIVPDEIITLGKKLVGLSQDDRGVDLKFADGTAERADIVIGADGVHSVVREWMHGPEQPTFTGRVAYRTTFPTSLLNGMELAESTKWMSNDRHIVIYYINSQRSEIYFVTSTPEPEFSVESWSAKGDMNHLRELYKDFHPQVRGVLAACPEVHKWALVVREPLPFWSKGRVALLGDACHPMLPYLAQGAATSIEDAAVLSRCLDGIQPGDIPQALRIYEASRLPRTATIQHLSGLNDMARYRLEQDQIMGYDAWEVPLTMPPAPQAMAVG